MDELNPRQLPFINREMLDFSHSVSFTLIADIIAHTTDPIEIRGYTKAGSFVQKIVPTASNAIQTFNLQIPDIPINISVFYKVEDFPLDAAHVAIHLGVGTDRVQLLCQGTVSSYQGLSWPTQHPLLTMQAEGLVMEYTGTNAAAGANYNQDTPANEVWEILGGFVTLVTDGNAANRTINVNIASFNGALVRRSSTTAQTATQTITYYFVMGGTTAVLTSASEHEIGLPATIIIPPVSNLGITITNKQAGDNLGAPNWLVRKHYAPRTAETILAN